MRRAATIGNDHRAGLSGFVGPARVLIELTA